MGEIFVVTFLRLFIVIGSLFGSGWALYAWDKHAGSWKYREWWEKLIPLVALAWFCFWVSIPIALVEINN